MNIKDLLDQNLISEDDYEAMLKREWELSDAKRGDPVLVVRPAGVDEGPLGKHWWARTGTVWEYSEVGRGVAEAEGGEGDVEVENKEDLQFWNASNEEEFIEKIEIDYFDYKKIKFTGYASENMDINTNF